METASETKEIHDLAGGWNADDYEITSNG